MSECFAKTSVLTVKNGLTIEESERRELDKITVVDVNQFLVSFHKNVKDTTIF